MDKYDVTEKMKYELWWQYLQESEKYKTLCEWFCEKEKKPSSPRPENISREFSRTFDFFGDIFSTSFDKWWKTKQARDPGIGVVEYSKGQMSHEFDSVVNEFFKSHGREPCLSEFKNLFIDRVFDYLPGCFPFRTCFHPSMSTKDLADQFSMLIRAKRKLPELQNYEKEIKSGWMLTSGRFRYDELKRYLFSYRLKRGGMKIGDIIEKYNSDNPAKQRFDEADFYQDIRYAKKIIENVEIGCFPGEYS